MCGSNSYKSSSFIMKTINNNGHHVYSLNTVRLFGVERPTRTNSHFMVIFNKPRESEWVSEWDPNSLLMFLQQNNKMQRRRKRKKNYSKANESFLFHFVFFFTSKRRESEWVRERKFHLITKMNSVELLFDNINL
jgi:hypothetical protein